MTRIGWRKFKRGVSRFFGKIGRFFRHGGWQRIQDGIDRAQAIADAAGVGDRTRQYTDRAHHMVDRGHAVYTAAGGQG